MSKATTTAKPLVFPSPEFDLPLLAVLSNAQPRLVDSTLSSLPSTSPAPCSSIAIRSPSGLQQSFDQKCDFQSSECIATKSICRLHNLITKQVTAVNPALSQYVMKVADIVDSVSLTNFDEVDILHWLDIWQHDIHLQVPHSGNHVVEPLADAGAS
ncbi:hypothetical protein BDD12DRAFT_895336 [Trichophaea hybrida]|nr:hypothetical protein BDD12DRAFT_895336 [Trichophaea hybrida]